MDNAETTEGKDVAIAMEIQETVNIDHDIMKFKQRYEEPLITELEIWFSNDNKADAITSIDEQTIWSKRCMSDVVSHLLVLITRFTVRNLARCQVASELCCAAFHTW